MWLFRPKSCIFCGSQEDIRVVPDWGCYGEPGYSRYAYHVKCVQEIIENPNKFGHKIVDKAIHIMDLEQHWKGREQADRRARKIREEDAKKDLKCFLKGTMGE